MTAQNPVADASGKIIPNSFQTPNFYVDECMPYLTGNEMKCMIYIARKTFGWQKRSDRIAKSQIAAVTGLGNETVDKVMSALVEFGLVLRLAENNAVKNNGVEWALQTDSDQVRFDLLRQRLLDQEKSNRKKTSKARQHRNPQGGGDVGQLGGGVVEQTPQKPLFKTTRKHGGADAPARATVPERIADFPEDCRAGAALMYTVFNLLPPEKPERDEKGGDFALWIKGLRALIKLAREYNVPLERAMSLAHQRWNQAPFTVAHPGALKKIMTSALAQQTQSQRSAEAADEFSLAEHLKNFKPRSPEA